MIGKSFQVEVIFSREFLGVYMKNDKNAWKIIR